MKLPNYEKGIFEIIKNIEKKKILTKIFVKDKLKKISEVKKEIQKHDLKVDDECIKQYCKYGTNVSVFEYLIENGAKPDMEDVCKIIQRLCSHANIQKIIGLVLKK